jgi:hypothetical protein
MKQVDWSKTLIHCSAISNIMGDNRKKSNMELWEEACAELIRKESQWEKLIKKSGPRGDQIQEAIKQLKLMLPVLELKRHFKSPLSEGCKTFLGGVYATEKYGKWSPSKDIGSRQTEKGTEVEDDSLTLVSRLEKKLLVKNEERVENDWFSGHPDAFEGDNLQHATIIHDVKSPWDIETFFSYLGKDLPRPYYWQMQGYMDLTGATVAEVHFCLVNTPERFIKDTAGVLLRNKQFISDLSPDYLKAEAEIINNMTFDDMPLSDKRIKFTVKRNDDDIEKARLQVEKCREWLMKFERMHLFPEEEVEIEEMAEQEE